MKCYICHKPVPHYEYTRHVGAHLVDDETGSGHLQSDASDIDYDYEYDEDSDHSDGYSDYSYEEDFRGPDTVFGPTGPLGPLGPLGPTGPIGPTRPPGPRMASVASPRTSSHAAVIRSPPNAFQIWFKNFKPDSPQYTTIDGQKKRNSDSETEGFIQGAKFLRDTSKGEVVKNVKEFKGFSDSERKACLKLVRDIPIFPGLVAYVYTHLVKCPPRGWFWDADWSDRVAKLTQLVGWWNEDGDVNCIMSCDMIKKRLLEFLRDARYSPDNHKCNPALLNGTTMLNCDTRNFTAVAALCITEQQKGKLLLVQRGIQAIRLVELFHSLLEINVELEERYWRCFFNALVMFSKECGYCPRGIYLADDSISGLVLQSQGAFGEVSKGKIGSRLVAVKVLKRKVEVGLSEYKKELSKEAIVWRHLCHPNCLPLYGVYEMPTKEYINVALVSPWMEKGTLADYLKKNSENSEPNRTRLMLDVVRGLNYLHSMKPHIAHRDIKPQNILITNNGRACLADFGLVSVFDTDEHFRTATNQLAIGGTPPYMALEMLDALKSKNDDAKRRLNSRACDMYALGCTIYVVYTDKSPHEVQVDLMSDKLPVKISADMWSFVQNLCNKDPSKRLTAEMAVSWMEEKARQEGTDASLAGSEKEWKWRGPSSDKCLWSV